MSDLARGPDGSAIALPASALRDLRGALLDHYDRVRRDLPWRGETDAYRVWVSEVMLQQTRVETVIPYYRRWVGLFPDLASLADASRDDVLLAWQGLGYYRRAANLHQGARVVRERFDGRLPDSSDALRALPGIGEYTAGAVASIAFGEVVPAVDGNVKRVLARLFDEPAPGAVWLRRTAAALIAPERPGDWNQALMELGATVCTPRGPACDACPWAGWCKAHAAGTELDRPAPPKRKDVPARYFASAVVVDPDGRVLLVRRPEGGLLAGMWSFPEAEIDGDRIAAARGAATGVGAVVEEDPEAMPGREPPPGWTPVTGRAPSISRPHELAPVRHRFTHLDATYLPVLLAGRGTEAENRRWIPLNLREDMALPVAQEKIAKAAEAALTSGESPWAGAAEPARPNAATVDSTEPE